MLQSLNDFLLKSIFFLIIGLPLVSITGPFLTDLFISVSSLFFLIYSLINKKFKYFKNIFFIIFIIWNLYLILNSLLSKFPLLSLESSLFYFRFGIFSICVYFIIKKFDNFIYFFFISLLLVFVFLIFNSFYQYYFLIDLFGNSYDGIRLSSVFGEEKILGSYMSRLVPLLIGLFLTIYNKDLRMIIFGIIILILVDVIVYLSGERVAFFNLLLFSLILIFLTKSFKVIRISAFLVSVVFILFVSIQTKSSFDRMVLKTIDQTNLLGKNPNLFSVQHEVIYLTSLKIYKDNYLFGIGPKNFREYCKIEEYKTFTEQDFTVDGCQTHPHNFYIQLLTETGPIGTFPIIFTFLTVIFIYFKDLYFSLFKKNKYLEDNFIILSSTIVINLWPFVPSGNFFNNYVSFLIYLPLGFIIYMILEKKYEHNK